MGFFSAEMLAEARKPGPEVYKRLTIAFPPTTEVLTFLPDATELADANHTAVGAATFHEALDDPIDSPDDDTSYVRHDANDTTAESRLSFGSLPDDVTEILEVRLLVRARSQVNSGAEDDGSWIFALRVNGTNYQGDVAGVRFFNPAYRTQGVVFALSPDTLLAWTPAEFDALEACIISQPDAQGDAFGQRFSQVALQAVVSRSRVGRYSDIGLNSRSQGLWQARVLGWDDVEYSVAGSSNAIQRPAAGVLLADTDGELSEIFAGGGVDEIRRSTVAIEYISPNVSPAGWATIFTGILSAWDEPRPHQWKLDFAEDDSSLNGKVTKAKVNERDFPTADPDAYELFHQVVYGRQDSEGLADEGMVPCPNLDKVLWRRGVTNGIAKSIIRVYSQGNTEDPPLLRTQNVPPTPPAAGNATTAEYEVITPIINGRQMTIAQFNLAGASQEEIDKFNQLEISADVEGLDEDGDGAGILLTNPADIFRHFFANFVYNDWRSGAWYTDADAPIDADLFDETRDFLNLVGQAASRFIGGRSSATTARSELNSWAEDMNLRVFWTEEGKLGVLPFHPFTLEVFLDDPWIQQGIHDLEDPSFSYDTSALFDRMLLAYAHQPNGDGYKLSIEVRDESVGEEKTETLEAPWLPSALPEASP